jgi:hypothetical protein
MLCAGLFDVFTMILLIILSVYQAENGGFYPAEMAKLKGKSMLFRVERNASVSVVYDGSFRVKRVCVDPEIISEFAKTVEDCPPEKVCMCVFCCVC